MPKCKKSEGYAIDYVHALLPKSEAVPFEQHLKTCDDCAEEVRSLTALLRLTDEVQSAVTLPEDALRDIEVNVYKRLAAESPSLSRFRSWVAIFRQMWEGHRIAAVSSVAIALIAIAIFVTEPFHPKTTVQLSETQSADARMEQYRQRDIQRSLEEALIRHHLRNDAWETASQFQRMKEQAQGTNWVKVANTHLQNLPVTAVGY